MNKTITFGCMLHVGSSVALQSVPGVESEGFFVKLANWPGRGD